MSYHIIFTSQYSNHDTEMRFKRTRALCAAEAPVSGYRGYYLMLGRGSLRLYLLTVLVSLGAKK